MFNQIPYAGAIFDTAYQGGAADASVTTGFSFASQPFGAAASGRYVLVGAAAGGNDRDVTGLTIGGVSASLVAGNSAIRRASLWIAAVPTGTTGTVAFSASATAAGAGILIWSLYPDAVVHATTTTLGASLTVADPGAVIGVGFDSRAAGTTISWTGLTADGNVGWTSSGVQLKLSGARLITPGAVTVNMGGSSGGPYGFAAASLGI